MVARALPPEEKLAAVLASGIGSTEAAEIFAGEWDSVRAPTPEQLQRWWGDRLIAGIEEDEKAVNWLVRFALERLDEPKLRAAISARVNRWAPTILQTVRDGLGCQEPPKPRKSDADRVLLALRQADAEAPGGLHSFRLLRRIAAGLSGARFEAAVIELARARRIIVHHTDYPAGMTDAERSAAVLDDGTYYVGAALPPGA